MRFLGKFFCLLLLVYLCLVKQSLAYECDNRFVTFINPVRDRQLWTNNSLEPIVSQKKLLSKYGFVASWLVQYDVLNDLELSNYLSDLDDDELGLFLEISESLATDAGVYYKLSEPWYAPNLVFLSGYSRSDRRKLIDTFFDKFIDKFGFVPKSVGAWWIDSYSSQYMETKYGIESVLIVADQKTTDDYGVWGQWWGWSYYPSPKNILIPCQHKSNLVVLQWAQRHPFLAYFGQGPQISNNSLQANDYTSLGKGIDDYFAKTVPYYLDCRNNLGQITIGMETGMEGYKYIQEYEQQLNYLNKLDIDSLTMSQYSSKFKQIYPKGNPDIVFGDSDYEWKLTKDYRQNRGLGERINYKEIAFADYFKSDNNAFLDRDLTKLTNRQTISYWPVWLIVWLSLILISLKLSKDLLRSVSVGLATTITGFLFFRSFCQAGWCVYFGPEINMLMIAQPLIVLLLFVVFWYVSKYIDIGLYILSFGFIYIFSVLRYTEIDGLKIFGLIWQKYRLVGLSHKLSLVNRDLGMLAMSALKLDFNRLYSDWKIYFIVMPVCQIVIAWGLKFVFNKLNKKLVILLKIILLLLVVFYITSLLMSDPLVVN